MVGMNIDITGIDKILANLGKIQMNIQSSIKPGLKNASEKLRDSAINNLSTSKWPISVVDAPIRSKETWQSIDSGINAIILQCQSEHALAVEKGTFASPKLRDGRFYADELTTNQKGFAVGANQDAFIGYRGSIAPQPAKNYLTQAMGNPSTISAMITEVGNILSRAIRSI